MPVRSSSHGAYIVLHLASMLPFDQTAIMAIEVLYKATFVLYATLWLWSKLR